jgi:preprotein translocase subunit SecG
MTITVLIIVNVFAALAIIVLALMQQSKGDMGSAFGGGGSQSMFGSRGSANFLSRSTAIMCTVFFISSLALAYVYAKRADINSVVTDSSVVEQTLDSMPEAKTEAEEGVPSIPQETSESQIAPDQSQSEEQSIPSVPE